MENDTASLKLKLKRWERNFVKLHDRKPSKSDVPDEILDLYKQYGALRQESHATTKSRSPWTLPPQAHLGIRRRLSSFANLKSRPHPPVPPDAQPHPPATPPDSPCPSPPVTFSLPHPLATPPDLPLMMPGHCTFKSSHLKFGGVSREWLDSCKPDMSGMEESCSQEQREPKARQAEESADIREEGAEVMRELSAEVIREQSTEVMREEGAEVMREQSAEVMREVMREQSMDVMREEGAEVMREQSVDVMREESAEVAAVKRSKPKGPPTASKAVSDNFVKLNMKTKRYSRRGRAISGSAHKRAEWKRRQNGDEKSGARGKGVGRFVCFKCGQTGHWARNCRERGGSSNLGCFSGEKVNFSEAVALGFEEEMDQGTLQALAEESPFPTISEAAAMVVRVPGEATATISEAAVMVAKVPGEATAVPTSEDVSDPVLMDGEDSGEPITLQQAPPPSLSHTPSPMEPLFATEQDRIISTPTCVLAALKKLGFSHFRPGQEEAVMRVLSGISTLLITGTGSGKSLCYQLPAYLYGQTRPPCITIVVSPLVSLMDDQVRQFPRGLMGACLHTNQTHPQREKVLRQMAEGKVDVLLLSPEALVGGALWRRRRSGHSLHDLPPVAFACIDEVHCISEWSHNFRPSYLQLYKVLRGRLGVKCVLGLTATATHTTGLSVARHLGVAEENIIRGPTLPDNLHITVSCDQDRDQALLELLSAEPFTDLQSIIVYCTRQQTVETVAQMLRTNFQFWKKSQEPEVTDSTDTTLPDSKGGRKRPKSNSRKMAVFAECYHAGMSAAQRRSVQNKFMSGAVRVVVATVAFGMGLNKADVRAIIHYNMPKSFESFVQEIGRAGRDGDPAYCHVFINKEESDLHELYRHPYSNSVDSYAIKKLVERALPLTEANPSDPSPPSNPQPPRGREVAIPIESTVLSLDVREECLATLLCYVELQGWLEVSTPVYDTCTLKCYGGARQLRALARKVPAVAAAAARLREKGVDLDTSNHMTFSVIETADCMGWDSAVVRSELMGLQQNDRGTCPSATPSPSGTVLVEMEELAFHVTTRACVTSRLQDSVIRELDSRVTEQVKCEVQKMQILHAVLRSVATDTHFGGVARFAGTLKNIISRYFDSDGLSVSDLAKEGIPAMSSSSELSAEEEDLIGHDAAAMVNRFSDHSFTGRAVARIFQGISSPKFPAMVWGSQRGFWRKYLHVDFNVLCQLATKKLLECR